MGPIKTKFFSTTLYSFYISEVRIPFSEPAMEFYEAQNLSPKMLMNDGDFQLAFGSLLWLDEIPTWNALSDEFFLFGALTESASAVCNGFFLPQVLIHSKTMTLFIKHEQETSPNLSEFMKLYQELNFSYCPKNPLPRSYEMSITPHESLWTQWIDRAKEVFSSTGLNKVVLSRMVSLHFSGSVPLTSLLDHIASHSFHGVLFCFSNRDKHFFGRTPELLVEQKNDEIRSEALAGTADQKSLAFLQNAKIDEEFSIVAEHIKCVLERHTQKLFIEERKISQASNIFHVKQPFSGAICSNFSLHRLIQELHPTPALGGSPKEKAKSFIEKTEQHLRGNYSHPFGILSKSHSKLYIALRCAQLQQNKLLLYSGAGIVKNSDPSLEWRELNLKLHLWKPLLPQNAKLST